MILVGRPQISFFCRAWMGKLLGKEFVGKAVRFTPDGGVRLLVLNGTVFLGHAQNDFDFFNIQSFFFDEFLGKHFEFLAVIGE